MIKLINGQEWPPKPKTGMNFGKRPRSDLCTLNPSKPVRARMESVGLNFMNKGEIQLAAVKF